MNTKKLYKLLPILALISFVACNKPVVTPTVTATQILQRVDEFQNTIIDLYSSNSISPEHALLYNKFCVLAAKSLKELPLGWQSSVKAVWNELLVAVPLETMEPKVQYAAKLVDALISVL